MRIRFQADADLNPAIGRAVVRREPAIDWRPAQKFIPDATPDPDVLEFAADDGRVLVSRDVSTIPHHFATFARTRLSPGVVLIPPETAIGDVIERLLLLWAVLDRRRHGKPDPVALNDPPNGSDQNAAPPKLSYLDTS